jgi:LEA14-like dessication related protein
MSKGFVSIIGLWLVSLLGGCAGMTNPHFEPPVVSLSSFRMVPQQAVSPTFEIGLHIINPNREPLSFEGIYYTVNIEGYDILAGVSNDLPTVDPYGEADVTLEAGVDLVKSIRLISSLMQQPRDRFTYSFKAKLDPGGLNPRITIQEDGEFSLQN